MGAFHLKSLKNVFPWRHAQTHTHTYKREIHHSYMMKPKTKPKYYGVKTYNSCPPPPSSRLTHPTSTSLSRHRLT